MFAVTLKGSRKRLYEDEELPTTKQNQNPSNDWSDAVFDLKEDIVQVETKVEQSIDSIKKSLEDVLNFSKGGKGTFLACTPRT